MDFELFSPHSSPSEQAEGGMEAREINMDKMKSMCRHLIEMSSEMCAAIAFDE